MKRVVSFFTRLCEAYLPDAFLFCLILTLVVFSSAMIFTTHPMTELVQFWGQDFWSLNAFAMQMVFVLISGHMLATTPLVSRVLQWLTSLVKTETQAIVLLSLFSISCCFLNWGFGLIVSGILALELARKLKRVNFGLFVATAYAGFVVWHAGFSGSIPLKIAGQDEILRSVYPEFSIPLTATIFSHWNLVIVGLLFVSMPLLSLWMQTGHKVEVRPAEPTQIDTNQEQNFRSRIENFWGFNLIFFVFFAMTIFTALTNNQTLDINRVNVIFLSLALLLHKTPARFLSALKISFPYAAAVVIQFPFYAGLMGLMQHSGLADQLSQIFVEWASITTLPLFTFFSAGLVNFFIPSGGGQWVVQGPIMLKAARDLGADPARISMALAWGDAWTNLIQPFWALPILGMAGLKLKDIMGYCLVFTFFSGLIISVLLLFL